MIYVRRPNRTEEYDSAVISTYRDAAIVYVIPHQASEIGPRRVITPDGDKAPVQDIVAPRGRGVDVDAAPLGVPGNTGAVISTDGDDAAHDHLIPIGGRGVIAKVARGAVDGDGGLGNGQA